MSDRDFEDYEEFQEYKKYRNKKKRFGGGFSMFKFVFALVAVLVIVVLIVVLSIMGYKKYLAIKNPEPEVTSSMLMSYIEDESELTTAKLTYRGVIHYEEGDIPFITKKTYNMVYEASVEAGVDLSEVEIDVTANQVIVKMPDVKLEEPVVDVDTIDFYDESFTLFSWDSKEDGVEAVKLAEANCKEYADMEELKATASENAEKVISDLLKDLIGDKKLVFD